MTTESQKYLVFAEHPSLAWTEASPLHKYVSTQRSEAGKQTAAEEYALQNENSFLFSFFILNPLNKMYQLTWKGPFLYLKHVTGFRHGPVGRTRLFYCWHHVKSHVRVRAINEPPWRIDLNITLHDFIAQRSLSLRHTVLLSSCRANMTVFALNYLKAEHKCACSEQMRHQQSLPHK